MLLSLQAASTPENGTLHRMTAEELEEYLHIHIPLSAQMGVQVQQLSDESITLLAPLAPNINHHQTAFGGSITTLATLAAWSWLHSQLRQQPGKFSLVIRSGNTEYLKPIEGDFEAVCLSPQTEERNRFLEILQRKGRARLELQSQVRFRGETAAEFRGTFAALALTDSQQSG